MLHGPERQVFDLDFALPAECADRLKDGRADIGIVPVAALLDQDLKVFRGAGIACHGAVRSILLISKTPFGAVRTLATDSSSRSSALLSRIILSEAYGVRPEVASMAPDLDAMLAAADAALIIGDPALRLDPASLESTGLRVADLGEEWLKPHRSADGVRGVGRPRRCLVARTRARVRRILPFRTRSHRRRCGDAARIARHHPRTRTHGT